MWNVITIGAQNFLSAPHQKILVDCGIGKDLVKKLLRETGEVKTCLISHAHTDHYGGLKYLLKSSPEVRLFAHPEELPFLINPGLEPALLFGGYFPGALATRWLLGPAQLPIEQLVVDAYPDIEFVLLPGHSPALFGIAWNECLFTSDALFGEEILTKYPLLYHYDPGLALKTLQSLDDRYNRFIPAHGSAGGPELLAGNRTCIERAFDACEATLVRGTLPLDEMIRLTMERLSPAGSLETYFLNRSALTGYLSVLERNHRLRLFLESNQVFVQKKS